MSEKTPGDLLKVVIEQVGADAAIVRLSGEVDMSSAPILSQHLTDPTQLSQQVVIIDATGVTFMDSSGLHALVEGKRSLHSHDKRIFLVPSPQVRRVLELVFPDALFARRVDSVDEALAALDEELDTV